MAEIHHRMEGGKTQLDDLNAKRLFKQYQLKGGCHYGDTDNSSNQV